MRPVRIAGSRANPFLAATLLSVTLVVVTLFVRLTHADTCTVGSSGSQDFVTIQEALDNCGAPGESLMVLRLANQTFAESGLVFPATLTELTLEPINSGAQGKPVLLGAAHIVDESSHTWLTFDGVVLDGGNTLDKFFAGEALIDTNLTIHNSIVRNFQGPRVFHIEACSDNVLVDVRRTNFSAIAANVFDLRGFRDFFLYYARFVGVGGHNTSDTFGAVIYLLIGDVSEGSVEIVQPTAARLCSTSNSRCRACLDSKCNARCDAGDVQFYDAATTDELGLCEPENGVEVYNSLTGLTTVLNGVPPLYCRTWRSPKCQTVKLERPSNVTGQPNPFGFFQVGDVYFQDTNTQHFCVPGGTLSPYTWSFVEHLPSIGSTAPSAARGWSSGTLSAQPTINTTCVCEQEPPFGDCASEFSLLCEYAIGTQTRCNEGVAECCVGNCSVPLYAPCSCTGMSTHDEQNDNDGATYVCVSGQPTCPCTAKTFNTMFPPARNSTFLFIENITPRLERFAFYDPVIEGYDYGVRLAQVEVTGMNRFAINPEPHVDEFSAVRILHSNDGERVSGYTADYNIGAWNSMWQWPCNDGCARVFTTEEEAACIVDDEANPDTPGFGVTIFQTIQLAYNKVTSGGCKRNGQRSICIRAPVQYFAEVLDLEDDADHLVIYSIQDAPLVGDGHIIHAAVKNLTFIGLTFSHTGNKQQPYFLIRGNTDLRDLNIHSCTFEVNDARRGGIADTSRILNFVLRHSTIRNVEETVVRIKDADTVTIEFNTVENCMGKCLQFLGTLKWMRINWNQLNETRGGAKLKGAPFITASSANNDEACDGLDGRECQFWGNKHYLDTLAESYPDCYRDTCFYVSRGAWNVSAFVGNRCVKSQYGFDFWMVPNVGTGELPQLMLANPEVRPSLAQTRLSCNSKKLMAFDYRIRTFNTFGNAGGSFWNVRDEATVNFLDPVYAPALYQAWLNRTYQCNVNWNYGGTQWLRDYSSASGTLPAYGFHLFRNISDADTFCPALPGDDSALVYVTNRNGSRHRYEDAIVVDRAVWLMGDEQEGRCRTPQFRPVVRGLWHVVNNPYHNQTLMVYAFRQNTPLSGDWVWASAMPQQLAIWDRCAFDGRLLQPESDVRVLDLLVGQTEETVEHGRAIKKGKLPPITSGALFFTNCTMNNWAAVEATEFDTDTWPYVEGLRVSCVNRINARSLVVVQGSNFTDLDSYALFVQGCNRVLFDSNNLTNVAGRSPRNDAAVKIVGNTFNSNYTLFTANQSNVVWITNNTLTQRDVVFKLFAENVMNPMHVAGYRLSLANGTDHCFLDNVVRDLPTPVHWERMQLALVNNCSLRNVTSYAADRRSKLRAVCEENDFPPVRKSQWHSYVYDIGVNRDRYGDFLECDVTADGTCCDLSDPLVCFVDRFDLPGYQRVDYYSPRNPWYRRFVFDDLGDAILNCQARRREIVLVGSQDLFGLDDGIDVYKVYTFWFNYTVGPRLLQVFNATDNTTTLVPSWDDLVVRGSRGMEVCTPLESHFINTTDSIRVRIEGVRFTHCRPGASGATWAQPSWASSERLTLDSNIFNGARTPARPIDGVYDDKMRVLNSLFINYTTGVDGLRLQGRTCNSSTATLRFSGNTMVGFAGATLEVLAWPSYSVTNNDFVLCGGRTNLRNYMSMMGVCDTPLPGRMEFAHNVHTGDQNATASLGRWTAYAFDPLPNYPPKLRLIDNNAARGLEVGMRLLDYENNPPRSDPKQRLRIIWANGGNYRVEGEWHDLVEGDWALDVLIDTAPDEFAQKKRFCDDENCLANDWYLIVAIVGVAIFLSVLCAIVCALTSRRLNNHDMTHINFLGVDVPSDPSRWLAYFGAQVRYGNRDPLQRDEGRFAMPSENLESMQRLREHQARMQPERMGVRPNAATSSALSYAPQQSVRSLIDDDRGAALPSASASSVPMLVPDVPASEAFEAQQPIAMTMYANGANTGGYTYVPSHSLAAATSSALVTDTAPFSLSLTNYKSHAE